MIRLAMLVLPNVFASGIGAMFDAYSLVMERRRRIFAERPEADTMVTLTVLSQDGASPRLDERASVNVDRAIATGDAFDLVWVPAFRAGGERELPGRLSDIAPSIGWLANQADRGAQIAASGSAMVLPLAAVLLESCAVPVLPALLPTITANFPRVTLDRQASVVEAGNVLIASGMAHDHEVLARGLGRVLSPSSGHWLRAVVGMSIEGELVSSGDTVAEAARLWIEQRFSQAVSMRDLAGELHVDPSVLIRRFRAAFGTTPSAYLTDVRLATAKRLLGGTRRSVESIAECVGYNDSRTFRLMFRKQTGMSARDWRVKFTSEYRQDSSGSGASRDGSLG